MRNNIGGYGFRSGSGTNDGGGYLPGFAAKYTSSGDLIWASTIDTYQYEGIDGIAADLYGNAYVIEESPSFRILLEKFDNSGKVVWLKEKLAGRLGLIKASDDGLTMYYAGCQSISSNDDDTFVADCDLDGNTISMVHWGNTNPSPKGASRGDGALGLCVKGSDLFVLSQFVGTEDFNPYGPVDNRTQTSGSGSFKIRFGYELLLGFDLGI